MRTTAVKHGYKYVINGTKCFITNGSHADWYTVYAKTDKEAGHRGISAFVVPRDAGVTVDKKEDKLGQRASDTAPSCHCSPGVAGRSSARRCPAHSRTTTSERRGIWTRSARVTIAGVATEPPTRNLQPAGSTGGTGKCSRRKCAAVGMRPRPSAESGAGTLWTPGAGCGTAISTVGSRWGSILVLDNFDRHTRKYTSVLSDRQD